MKKYGRRFRTNTLSLVPAWRTLFCGRGGFSITCPWRFHCRVELNQPRKAGSVELSDVIVGLVLVLGPLAVATASAYLRGLYRRLARRYERSLDDAYALSFEARATEARILNANVGYALKRAKRTVDETRKNSPDALRIQMALGQVSHWLDSAAKTSDRALRSLEEGRTRTKRSQARVFTRNDLDS
jgi:hypothetical protein